MTKRMSEVERYKKALGIVIDALEMYAREDSYHACAFAFDRPCGSFANDFSRVKDSQYNRPMPGKTARAAFRELSRRFGDLPYLSRTDL